MSGPIIAVQDAALDDLRARLRNTRWPLVPEGQGWARGTDMEYLRQLVDYWQTSFDWRAQESALGGFTHEVRWTELPASGHFTVWEEPEAFARELTALARDVVSQVSDG
jgi:pimeloyl-ACP methyl ester carboxylesterase